VSKGADHVTRQFERVHGPDGPTPDAEGKRRGTLEVPRLRRRPGDDRLKKPVGRDAPNRPDDVARLQRALSETGDYTFTAPRERSGVMSANLENAVTRYQRRTGLKPDAYVAPDGPTIQQIAEEAGRGSSGGPTQPQSTKITEDLAPLQGANGLTETSETQPILANTAASQAKTAEVDPRKERKRQCAAIQKEIHNAHKRVNSWSEQARAKSIEIQNVREAIAELANLEKFIKEQVWGEVVGRALRRYPAAALVIEVVDGIKNVNTVRSADKLMNQLQKLLRENAGLHDALDEEIQELEQLKADYNECLAKPAPEDRNENSPAVPTS
jgi:hypothetical protein